MGNKVQKRFVFFMFNYFGENDCKLNIFLLFFDHFVLNTIMHFEIFTFWYIQNTYHMNSRKISFKSYASEFFPQYLFTFYGEHMPAASNEDYYIIWKWTKKANTHSQYLQTTKFDKMFKHEFFVQFYIPKYYLEMLNGICQYAQIASYTLGHDFVENIINFLGLTIFQPTISWVSVAVI